MNGTHHRLAFLTWDELPQDAVNVFTNLQAVSLNNHLPAFQRCQ